MSFRYRKRSFVEKLVEDFPLVEVIVLGIIFIVSVGLLLIPKDFLYSLSVLRFISVF